ncbi:hypothetical protein TNCV_3827061 [Trichonephila clavipes]|nr:hypothetical protein TNCV_3827061 [Trichonephila clavipes]
MSLAIAIIRSRSEDWKRRVKNNLRTQAVQLQASRRNEHRNERLYSTEFGAGISAKRLRLLSMGCRLSFTIMAARLDVVTPRVQTINNDPMATCTGHFTAGGSIKFGDNRWV